MLNSLYLFVENLFELKFSPAGRRCEILINECRSNPCLHGSCIDDIGKYTCSCKPGYTGINCEHDINECDSNPCVRGQCIDRMNAFECKCPWGEYL